MKKSVQENLFMLIKQVNNLEVVTTTSEKYACYFGFTEKEVFETLDIMGLAHDVLENR